IRDWCISRQLWWGHRVPVWTIPLHASGDAVLKWLGEYFEAMNVAQDIFIESVGRADEPCVRICTKSEQADSAVQALNAFYQNAPFDPKKLEVFLNEQARQLAKRIMDGPAADQAKQDPDVLDTWFSSWLWPFATMGWTGDKTQDSNNPTLQ